MEYDDKEIGSDKLSAGRTNKMWASLIKTLKNKSGGRRPLEIDIFPIPLEKTQGREVEHTSSAVIDAFLSMCLPMVRYILSKKLIQKGLVLRDEQLVSLKENGLMENLPIQPLSVQVGAVRLVKAKSLRSDMDARPEFEWPERDQVENLMQSYPEGETAMVVVDAQDVECEIRLGRGIELAFPINDKLGVMGKLEIGSGGTVEEAWARFYCPTLRFWFVLETGKVYIAFMDKPIITPHLNVNVDRGHGDFLNKTFTKTGTILDNILGTVLSGFGPTTKEEQRHRMDKNWVGDKLGGILQFAIGKYKQIGNGRPIELNLEKIIQSRIHSVFDRSEKDIRANIVELVQELEDSLIRRESLNSKTSREEVKDSFVGSRNLDSESVNVNAFTCNMSSLTRWFCLEELNWSFCGQTTEDDAAQSKTQAHGQSGKTDISPSSANGNSRARAPQETTATDRGLDRNQSENSTFLTDNGDVKKRDRLLQSLQKKKQYISKFVKGK